MLCELAVETTVAGFSPHISQVDQRDEFKTIGGLWLGSGVHGGEIAGRHLAGAGVFDWRRGIFIRC